MNTEAVMCMALTSTKPSLMPLSLRQVCTSGVMLRNARRPGTSNQSSLRKDFTLPLWLPDNIVAACNPSDRRHTARIRVFMPGMYHSVVRLLSHVDAKVLDKVRLAGRLILQAIHDLHARGNR